MKWVKALLSPVLWTVLGCLTFILGIALMWDGYANGLPERSELITVGGMVQEVERISVRQPGGPPLVRFELQLSPMSKLVLTEKYLTTMQIAPADVYAMSGKTIEALITPKKNFEIWEFTANSKKLLTYGPENEVSARRSKTEASIGTRLTGIGLLILILGSIILRIRQWYRSSHRGPRQ
jgi:hypothetical protein